MTMIACVDCGHSVSDAAPFCPACGRPISAARTYGPPAPYAGAPVPDRLAAERNNVQIGYVMMAVAFAVWPTMIVAGIIGMTKRDALRGTWLESHAEWLMNTLLVSVGLIVAGFFAFLMGMVLFFPFGFMMIFAAGLGSLAWHVYRLIRGWTLLSEGKPAVGILSPPKW
ncbi:zinc-ribbon domain-containing protein [Longimicrobium sp.]|uniref:zinc-ribbon domain-containing protein n=1 Tax=Longimicrobium sp. TaxID=2029185 RepID=UPI002CE7D1C5|nr:zinc-ribbon domain-containing protein [Longimicrobium sp.]HSU15899.1 zinc-ribbon domain-containing protein [Longimicrobium sp.]